MSESSDEVQKRAKHWLKQNKRQLKESFCDPVDYPKDKEPVTVFMAGTPGAGKTEFSKSLVETFQKSMVRIDADEIREMMRDIGYNGKNASLYQQAVTAAVSNLYSHVVRNGQSALLDGTFAYANWRVNIESSLQKKRLVEIYYLYQDPEIAWKFVKLREKKQGRAVPREVFIKDYFLSIENVQKAKEIFGDKITVYFAKHNYEKHLEYVIVDVSSIADHLPKVYTNDELEDLIKYDDQENIS